MTLSSSPRTVPSSTKVLRILSAIHRNADDEFSSFALFFIRWRERGTFDQLQSLLVVGVNRETEKIHPHRHTPIHSFLDRSSSHLVWSYTGVDTPKKRGISTRLSLRLKRNFLWTFVFPFVYSLDRKHTTQHRHRDIDCSREERMEWSPQVYIHRVEYGLSRVARGVRILRRNRAQILFKWRTTSICKTRVALASCSKRVRKELKEKTIFFSSPHSDSLSFSLTKRWRGNRKERLQTQFDMDERRELLFIHRRRWRPMSLQWLMLEKVTFREGTKKKKKKDLC